MRTRSGIATAAALTLALAIWLMLGPGCSPKVELPTKVIFLGIDAADWKLIMPLLDKGRLPNFARLRAEGATGQLLTLQPLQKSPIVWTSIATGKVPYKHGIGGFLAPGDSVPYTGNVRRVKALWNILGDRGMKVGVVGWMVTWPAEQVKGYLVSDYVQYEDEKGIKLDRQTYPEDLFEEIDGLRLTEADVSDEAIAGFFPVTAPVDALAGQEWLKGYVKMVYAQDETFRRIAMDLAGKGVQFLTVYFEGIDSLCHAAWGFRDQPASPLNHLIDDYYVWIDGVLGQFMDRVDDRTLLVVVSDHGFRGPWHTEDGALLLGVDMHDYYGIAGFMGRNIRKGAGIPEANVLDVTPTILFALGLPVARDMDGSVITDIFDARFLKANPVRFVKTYETGPSKSGEPLKSPVDEKVKGKLKALGYIQ